MQTTFTLETVHWNDPRAVALRGTMDLEMADRYAGHSSLVDEQSLARQLASLAIDPDQIVATVLAVDDDGDAIGHAALRRLGNEWEVKRVVVGAEHRGRGVGRALMGELESVARRGSARRIILQTGDRQPDAVSLYERIGYTPIPVYAPYAETMPFSLCFEKTLDAA